MLKISKKDLPLYLKYPGLRDMICYLRGHKWYRVEIEEFVLYGRICKCCKTVLYPHFRGESFSSPLVVYKDNISSASDSKICIYEGAMEKLTLFE